MERALASAGGRFNRQVSGAVASALPVGASTLSAEVKRVSDEAIYVTKMLPLMLDNATTIAPNGQLPKLASDMFDERAVSAAQLAGVMEHAAEINGTAGADLRNEASWRLKSLAANLALLGQQTQSVERGNINWRLATDSLGAALVDVARLQSMLDRASDASGNGQGCNTSAPAAAQQLREAMAMLDLCRMRSACSNRVTGTEGAVRVSPEQVAARAQTFADRLIVQELASPDVVEASDGTSTLRPIDELRGRYGVCTKAADLREATLAVPPAAQAVAEGIAPVVQPVGNAVAPQDLVTGAVNSAIQVSAPAAAQESTVLEAASPAPAVPSIPQDEVIPAAAPPANAHAGAAEPVAPADPSPSFTGNLLTPPTSAFVAGGGTQAAVQPRH